MLTLFTPRGKGRERFGAAELFGIRNVRSAGNRREGAATPGKSAVHIVKELIQSHVGSVTGVEAHEFAKSGPVKCPGLVESRFLVVGPSDPRQRRKHRALVPALSSTARMAGRRSRRRARRRADASPVRGLCFRLRVQVT